MMSKSAHCSQLILAIGAAMAGQAGLPTADQILEKYVQGIGGKAALERLNSRYTKGTVEVPSFNASGTFEEYRKAPDKRILRSEFEGYGTVVQACDGTTAWAEDPQSGRRDLSGPELAGEKRQSDFYGALHMKEHHPQIAVTGKAKVGTRDAYVLETPSPEGGSTQKFHFDVESGLLLRIETQATQGPASVTFEDYRDVDGVKIPYTMKVEMPQLSLVYKTTEVKHQVQIEDAKFAKPAK